MGWVCISNFILNDNNERDWFSKQEVSRKLAELIPEKKAMIHIKRFRGYQNMVLDTLYRDCIYLSNIAYECLLDKFSKS